MRRETARVAAISSLATLLLGCASTPAPAPKASSAGAAAQAPAKASSGQAGASASAKSLPATSTNLEEQIRAAVTLRMHGDIAQATHALAQLVLVAPDDPRVLGEYGKALVQQNRSDDAAAFLKRAVQIKPGDWTLYSALGVAYDQMDDRKNAKVAYDRALLLHPADPAILNNYAVSRMLAKDYDGAQRLLMQAQAAGGNLPKITSNLQLLAQLRASKAPAPASTKAANTVSGVPNTIAPATASATLPGAMASRAANPTLSTSVPPAAGQTKSAAAVVVMQRVPADTPQAAPQRESRPDPKVMSGKSSMAAKAVSADRTASAGPRAITPGAASKSDVRPVLATKTSHPANASGRSPETGSANLHPTKSAATAQQDKARPMPALRTADQGE